MKRLMRVVLLFLSLSLTQGLLFGQFKPEEIAQRGQWEEFLKTADIIKFEPIGEGVTKPWKLYLKKGDIAAKLPGKTLMKGMEISSTVGSMKSPPIGSTSSSA